jgi:hypothetical protein
VWTGRKAAFPYPISPEPRTAVLVPGFRPTGNVQVFREGWGEGAMKFQPATIAGTREQLLALLGTKIPSLTHALIAVLRPGDERVSDRERERLWRAFGVPLFEQVVGRSGKLLATECEAHDGLHIENPGLELDGFALDATSCGCGRKTPRLRAVMEPELKRAAAGATL